MATRVAPRGWKAALEQEISNARLQAPGKSAVTAPAAGASSPEVPQDRFSEQPLPWHTEDSATAIALTHSTWTSGMLYLEQWLPLLALVAGVSFYAGWFISRWTVVRQNQAMTHTSQGATQNSSAAAQAGNHAEQRSGDKPQSAAKADGADALTHRSSPATAHAKPPRVTDVTELVPSAAEASRARQQSENGQDKHQSAGIPLDNDRLSSASSLDEPAQELSSPMAKLPALPSPHQQEAPDVPSSINSAQDSSISHAAHKAQASTSYGVEEMHRKVPARIQGEGTIDASSMSVSAALTPQQQASIKANSESPMLEAATSQSAQRHAETHPPDIPSSPLTSPLLPVSKQQASMTSSVAADSEPLGVTLRESGLGTAAKSLPSRPPPVSDPPLMPPQSLHSAEGEAAWQDAAQLVSAVAARLGVSIGDLGPGDRVQLIGVAVGAWQTFQQRDAHRTSASQGEEANLLRSMHNRLVQSGLTTKQAKHQAAEAARGMAALQATLTDCIMTGLALSVASLLYCGFRYGLLNVKIATCPSLMHLPPISILHPWNALAPFQAMACYLFGVGDLILGVLMVLITTFVALKTRLLSGYQAMPLYRLVLGLGLLCGAAGFVAVGKIGGDRSMWLLMWWAWIAAFVAAVMNLKAVYHVLQKPDNYKAVEELAKPNDYTTTRNACEDQVRIWGGRNVAVAAVKAVSVVMLGVWWPLAMGCVPFGRSVAGELIELLKRPGIAAFQQILF